jgi:hypothetical protein
MIGCQAAMPGLQPAEKRALHAMFGGSWEPDDPDVDLAIAGDIAALHRVLSRSTDPKLDGENLEATVLSPLAYVVLARRSQIC